jgi:hypothetical protein
MYNYSRAKPTLQAEQIRIVATEVALEWSLLLVLDKVNVDL